MNAQRWLGWTVTGLMTALVTLSALPDILQAEGAIEIMRHLGYPPYLLVFLGTAKMLGLTAILVPGRPRLKEWAFAGLTFDVSGALYSHLSVGDAPSVWMPAAIAFGLIAGSYIAYRARTGRDAIARDQPAKSERPAGLGPRFGLNA